MKNVLRACIGLCVFCLICAAPADTGWTGESDPLVWRASGDIILPAQKMDWDRAVGVEIQYIHWLSPRAGFGWSIGAQNWKANEDIDSYGESIGGGVTMGYAGRLEGSATMVPLSLGPVVRLEFNEYWSATAEFRLSYVFVNSTIQYREYAVFGRQGRIFAEEGHTVDVDIGNNVLFGTGAHLHFRFPQSMFEMFAGITSQYDLVRGRTTLPATPLTYQSQYDNELRGIGFRAGFSATF